MNQGATKSVSQSTIQRTLLRLGLRSRRLVRAPMLTAVHRRRRLEFARQYSSWTSTEWRQVAFSDESRFMLHRTDGRWRIRRETSERNHPATIAGTVQAGGGSIMVWGMFSWHSLGSLIIVEGTMDQYKYASVLADHVHPYMRIVFPQDDGIFQQDNARCHTAASVRAWFEEHQDEFTVLPWPANSPDLNPIEHLLDHLDRVVRAMDPQPRNLAQLATALESAWLNIPENTFRDLCDSLPARLAAVRSAKGFEGNSKPQIRHLGGSAKDGQLLRRALMTYILHYVQARMEPYSDSSYILPWLQPPECWCQHQLCVEDFTKVVSMRGDQPFACRSRYAIGGTVFRGHDNISLDA
ncbi:Transposable element Tcb1 transposase, partial [Stegodyphus mimosarum]